MLPLLTEVVIICHFSIMDIKSQMFNKFIKTWFLKITAVFYADTFKTREGDH